MVWLPPWRLVLVALAGAVVGWGLTMLAHGWDPRTHLGSLLVALVVMSVLLLGAWRLASGARP